MLYASSWLLTAFCADFPLFFSARVMDVILSDCYDGPIMKACTRSCARCRGSQEFSGNGAEILHASAHHHLLQAFQRSSLIFGRVWLQGVVSRCQRFAPLVGNAGRHGSWRVKMRCVGLLFRSNMFLKLTALQRGAAQVALGIVLACSDELLGMRDMEAMVDLLRFGVPQWPHERLQACHQPTVSCSVEQSLRQSSRARHRRLKAWEGSARVPGSVCECWSSESCHGVGYERRQLCSKASASACWATLSAMEETVVDLCARAGAADQCAGGGVDARAGRRAAPRERRGVRARRRHAHVLGKGARPSGCIYRSPVRVVRGRIAAMYMLFARVWAGDMPRQAPGYRPARVVLPRQVTCCAAWCQGYLPSLKPRNICPSAAFLLWTWGISCTQAVWAIVKLGSV